MRRMVDRKHRALFEVAHHAGAEPLGKADARCQHSGLREPRPNMITGRSARASSAAA